MFWNISSQICFGTAIVSLWSLANGLFALCCKCVFGEFLSDGFAVTNFQGCCELGSVSVSLITSCAISLFWLPFALVVPSGKAVPITVCRSKHCTLICSGWSAGLGRTLVASVEPIRLNSFRATNSIGHFVYAYIIACTSLASCCLSVLLLWGVCSSLFYLLGSLGSFFSSHLFCSYK